jgi:WD40 repeat protein
MFSPDARFFATAGRDSVVRLWDTETVEEIAQFKGHSGFVNSIAFSPDGKTLLSASDDGTARIYTCEECASRKDLLYLAERRAGR